MEHLPVGGLVGFQDDSAWLAGEGLLLRHPRRYTDHRREGVDDQRPALGAVHNDGGGLLKIGVVSELHLGPQVGDEHTGDPQGTSLAS